MINFGKLLKGEGNVMNAGEAYSLATYNEVVSDVDLVKRFITLTDQLIRNKSENNYFSLVMDLNDDVLRGIDDIIKYYKEKDFFVTRLNKDNLEGLVGEFLFLSWRR